LNKAIVEKPAEELASSMQESTNQVSEMQMAEDKTFKSHEIDVAGLFGDKDTALWQIIS